MSPDPTWLVDKVLASAVPRHSSIVVVGFWRSGTTFLMEQIARETGYRFIFEPLHYSVREARDLHPPLHFHVEGKDVTQWIPFRHPDQTDPALRRLIAAALRGRLSTPWTRRQRGLFESLSPHTVVKLVRANLIAAWIQNVFDVKPVWVVRHPGGILASIVRRKGGAPALRQILGDPRLLDWVLKQPGLERHFPEARALAASRGASPDEVIIRLWMATHWIPWRMSQLNQWSPTIVPYRTLVQEGRVISEIVAERALRPSLLSRRPRERGDSSTTKTERRGVSVDERIDGWRKEVSQESRDTIDRILGSFEDGFSAWVHEVTG